VEDGDDAGVVRQVVRHLLEARIVEPIAE